RKRHGVLGDPQDAPVGADEDHIERNVGILHPEAGRLLAVEVEQHALPFRQLLAEHQAFRLLLRSHSHFDCEDMYAALAGDFERLQFGRCEQAGTAERQGEERENGENGEQDTTHGQASMLEGPIITESPPRLSRARPVDHVAVTASDRNSGCWCAGWRWVSAKLAHAARLRDAPRPPSIPSSHVQTPPHLTSPGLTR